MWGLATAYGLYRLRKPITSPASETRGQTGSSDSIFNPKVDSSAILPEEPSVEGTEKVAREI